MSDASQYSPLGVILNDIRNSVDLDGEDKQFLTQMFTIQGRASKMPEGKVRAYRSRLAKSVHGEDNLRVLAGLWLQSCMGRKGIALEGLDAPHRLNMKLIASHAGIDKRDAHAILFLVAQSLPGMNGWSAGGVQ